jgi:exopolysaccharide biosynthesis protein
MKCARNLYYLFSLLFLFTSFNYAQERFDSVYTTPVGPGMNYTKYKMFSTPWSIDVFTAEMKNQYFGIESIKSNDLLAAGREKTTSMAFRRSFNNHWVVAAINADFFDLGTGQPNGIQIVNGEILRNENPGHPTVGFTNQKQVTISKPVFSSKLKTKDTLITINGLNIIRGSNQLVFYNSFFGSSTNTNNNGTEIRFHPVNSWAVNDTLVCIIDSIAINKGNIAMVKNYGVLSANGAAANYFNLHLHKGDTIKIYNHLTNSLKKMMEMVGGNPIVVLNGQTAPLDSSSFTISRHPRTAVGINQDTTKLFLITVDGRQPNLSLGMNLYELADFMKSIGVYNGINLDGGGSTTMVIRDSIMNSPSDGTERTVANALLVISKTQLGQVNKIKIIPKNAKIFMGKTFQFNVLAWDQYYNPIPVSNNQVTFQLSNPALGTINSSGLFTAGNQAATGFLVANYNGIIDSAIITVKTIGFISIVPKSAVTDKNFLITFKAKVFDTDSIEYTYPPQSFTWKSTDTTVGKIDVVGQFQGFKAGTTKIIASILGKADTATASVQIGVGYKTVDSLESLIGWNLSGMNYDSIYSHLSLSADYKTIGNKSFKLDYKFVYYTGLYNWIYIKPSIPIYGLPDSLFIDIRSDGAYHRIFFDVEDAVGNNFRFQCTKFANKLNVWDTLKALVGKTLTVFPINLKSVSIALGSGSVNGQTYTGVIYIDNIRVKYPEPMLIKNESNYPGGFNLYQNYPNPFNPSTVIKYKVERLKHISLKVYDILGREAAILVDEEKLPGTYEVEFSTLVSNSSAKVKQLSSGIYFYQLKSGDFIQTRKMILLR